MLATSIAACATARSDAPVWGAVAQAAGAPALPPLRPYTADQQRRAAAELATLPADGVVRGLMMPDYLRMRDQTRELRGEK